jgi:hypothetical protein
MFHGLDNRFLYSAYKIVSEFADRSGDPVELQRTGFFLKNAHKQLCFVTNRHMVDLHYPEKDSEHLDFTLRKLTLRGWRCDPSNGYPTGIAETTISDTMGMVFSSQRENDIACIIQPKVKSNGAGTAVIDYFLPHEVVATSKDFAEKLSVCDFVAFPGYPPWYDQLSQRPILRTGAIASDPRFDYSFSGRYDGKCVGYEAFSFGGSSGSPIFAVQKGPKPGYAISFPGFRELLMIGVNAGHLKAEKGHHSGISYFYKSPAILDIIDA